MTEKTPIPVTLIGGYLGAGKTTLVNRLLRQANGLRLAVLVNDFGELPIDADLIESQEGNILSIAGGCVCCSYGSDLIETLMELEKRSPAPDALLLETSGVALPSALAQSLQLVAGFALDGILVLADAETIQKRGSDPYLQDTIKRQLVSADIVLLNKTDLVSKDWLAETRKWLTEQAPSSRLIETTRADVPLPAVLGLQTHQWAKDFEQMHVPHTAHHSEIFPVEHPVHPEFLAKMLVHPDLDLIRVKGFVQSHEGEMQTLQIVGNRWQIAPAPHHVSGKGRIVCLRHNAPINTEEIARLIGEAMEK